MQRMTLTILLFLAFAIAMVAGYYDANTDNTHDDNNWIKARRCKYDSTIFQRRNAAMINSHAGSADANPSKNKIWQQKIYYLPQDAAGDWYQVADFVSYQYNYWNANDCAFVFDQYTYVVKPSGQLSIIYSRVKSVPLEPTFRTRQGKAEEGHQEYDVIWTTPEPFISAETQAAIASEVALSDRTLAYTFVDRTTGKVVNTDTIDVLIPNESRDYSLMLYYTGQPIVWVEIDSTSVSTPCIIQAAQAAKDAGQYTLQPDPNGFPYGVTNYLVYIWDVPSGICTGRSDTRSETDDVASIVQSTLAYQEYLIRSRPVA